MWIKTPRDDQYLPLLLLPVIFSSTNQTPHQSEQKKQSIISPLLLQIQSLQSTVGVVARRLFVSGLLLLSGVGFKGKETQHWLHTTPSITQIKYQRSSHQHVIKLTQEDSSLSVAVFKENQNASTFRFKMLGICFGANINIDKGIQM